MDLQIVYPVNKWPATLDIPLKAFEEVVSIDLENDLPEDPNDLKTLLIEESSGKEHWITIAAAYCNHGKINEGIQLIEMAVEVFQGVQSAPLHTFLTWAYLKLAKTTLSNPSEKEQILLKAENYLKNAIGSDPSWIGNMLATIDLYYIRGSYDKALETADLFVKGINLEDKRNGRQSRPNIYFILLKGKLLYQKKNYIAALRKFQELLVLNPTMTPDPRIGIGLCFWQLKDYKMAVKSWERGLKMDSTNVSLSILVLLGKFHDSLSNSENDQQFKTRFSEALQDLNNLYMENKENPVILTLLQTYFYLKHDYDKVISIYESKILPKLQLAANTIASESIFWCARAYYAKRDYRKAFLLFQESLKMNEDNLLAKLGLGQTQIHNSLVEESILTFENISKNQENIQELNYILGLLYASKCLGNISVLPTKETASMVEKAISFLEKYIKLTKAKKNQLIIMKSYLILSELYELKNMYKQSLDYLSKAIKQLNFTEDTNIPIEILNNLGCFHFINGDFESAYKYFHEASIKIDDTSPENITINYNIARTLESTNKEEAASLYQKILSVHSGYINARIRSIFLKFMNSKTEQFSSEMDEILKYHSSNLEVRAFYSWYLKNIYTHKINEDGENLEINHSRETLVKYDSHDFYALISLGNLYMFIARDTKKSPNPKEREKSRQSYLKAIQLFQKVLQVDPMNVFAAQGLAIAFAENKRYNQALEILRKIRDSLDNKNVHMNLAHCFLEMGEFGKAIENYEITLIRFGDDINKTALYSLLGRAWYYRGIKELSLDNFKKSLKFARDALEIELENADSKSLSSLKFNVALLEFQVAETLRRSDPKRRMLKDLECALVGLENGIRLLKELVSSHTNMISLDELQQRIQLGEGTMKSSLERCIKEQKDYDSGVVHKLNTARKLMEESEQKEKERLRKLQEEERIKNERKAEEYKKLQEEAQKLIQERDTLDDVVDYDDLPQSEDENFAGGEKVNQKPAAKRRKRKGKKSEVDETENVPKRKRQSKKPTIVENDEDEANETLKPIKGKQSMLSNEFIADSDDESVDSHEEKTRPIPENGNMNTNE